MVLSATRLKALRKSLRTLRNACVGCPPAQESMRRAQVLVTALRFVLAAARCADDVRCEDGADEAATGGGVAEVLEVLEQAGQAGLQVTKQPRVSLRVVTRVVTRAPLKLHSGFIRASVRPHSGRTRASIWSPPLHRPPPLADLAMQPSTLSTHARTHARTRFRSNHPASCSRTTTPPCCRRRRRRRRRHRRTLLQLLVNAVTACEANQALLWELFEGGGMGVDAGGGAEGLESAIELVMVCGKRGRSDRKVRYATRLCHPRAHRSSKPPAPQPHRSTNAPKPHLPTSLPRPAAPTAPAPPFQVQFSF